MVRVPDDILLNTLRVGINWCSTSTLTQNWFPSRYSWNSVKVGVKLQSTNQPTDSLLSTLNWTVRLTTGWLGVGITCPSEAHIYFRTVPSFLGWYRASIIKTEKNMLILFNNNHSLTARIYQSCESKKNTAKRHRKYRRITMSVSPTCLHQCYILLSTNDTF